MQQLRTGARRACEGSRGRGSSPSRTRFPGTRVADPVPPIRSSGAARAAAAHHPVANLLVGALLLLARPFSPGERLRLYVPELAEVVEAQLLRTGLLTTTLCTGSGVLVVPNAELLRPSPAAE